jgi:hypothetical protein
MKAFAGTALDGREWIAFGILDTGEQAWAVPIEPDELLSAWRIARDKLGETGRWPVAVTTWSSNEKASFAEQLREEKLFSRFWYGDEDKSPAAIIAQSAKVDLGAFFDEIQSRRSADPIEEEKEEDDGGSDRRHLEWYEPNETTALVLLPTPHSWETLAFLHFYAAADESSAPLLALLKFWNERYGAELVANWGTMLQFVVSRPPTHLEDAIALAREQILLAPCTTLLPGVPLMQHARALVGCERWFLHERP